MESSPRFRDLLQRRAARPLLGSDEVWKYREAASVLATFDFSTLNPRGEVSSETAKTELLADCDVMRSPDGTMVWSLRSPVRQAALRRLFSTQEIKSALDCNPDRKRTDEQQLLELYLTGGSLPPSETSSAEQGRALMEVVDWLSGVPEMQGRLP